MINQMHKHVPEMRSVETSSSGNARWPGCAQGVRGYMVRRNFRVWARIRRLLPVNVTWLPICTLAAAAPLQVNSPAAATTAGVVR